MTTAEIKEKGRSGFESPRFKEVRPLCVKLDSDDMVVVAYENFKFPSVIITNETFARDVNSRQEVNFKTVSFESYEGYRIWSCEIVDDEMRVCLVR